MRNTQEGMSTLISRTKRETASGLKALEDEYNGYAKGVAQIQASKAGMLKARSKLLYIPGTRRKWRPLRSSPKNLKRSGLLLLATRNRSRLRTKSGSWKGLWQRTATKYRAFKEKGRCFWRKELDGKYNEAVTQAAVADQTQRSKSLVRVFEPGERVDFGRTIKALKENLEKLRNSRAELKVKSDSAGQNQERISRNEGEHRRP